MSKTLLVIPHYNDAFRLESFLDDLARRLPVRFAILVSDDGSDAEEVSRMRALVALRQSHQHSGGPVFLDPLIHSPNTGKGGAVKRGWLAGRDYSLLAFADADGAVDAGEIARAEQHMRSADPSLHALLGSRVKMLGRSVNRKLHRHLMGRIFATFISRITGLGAYDTQCGLKIITQSTFQTIHPHMVCPGFAFDVEMCLLMQKAGLRVQEFPVDWIDIAGSKVRLLRDSVRMTVEVLNIQRRVALIGF